MNTQSTASIQNIIDLAIQTFPAGTSFTGYETWKLINAIHEVLDRPAIKAPQPIYNRLYSYLKVKTLTGVRLNQDDAAKFIMAYLTGAAKPDTTATADKIKAALAAQASKTVEQSKKANA